MVQHWRWINGETSAANGLAGSQRRAVVQMNTDGIVDGRTQQVQVAIAVHIAQRHAHGYAQVLGAGEVDGRARAEVAPPIVELYGHSVLGVGGFYQVQVAVAVDVANSSIPGVGADGQALAYRKLATAAVEAHAYLTGIHIRRAVANHQV